MSPRLRSRASSSPASTQTSNHCPPPADEQQNPDSKLFFEEDENWLLKSLSKLTNPSLFLTSDPPNLDRRAGVRTEGDHDQDAEAVRG
ncbi:hypothetical protein ACJRO7_013001 [Eucalyptus globulus]|uniref:Uncharacterized protein n=1 Tax=Eucalyptus globulus TaxID=34317 RepID=A0ABD3LLP2_EUCGL